MLFQRIWFSQVITIGNVNCRFDSYTSIKSDIRKYVRSTLNDILLHLDIWCRPHDRLFLQFFIYRLVWLDNIIDKLCHGNLLLFAFVILLADELKVSKYAFRLTMYVQWTSLLCASKTSLHVNINTHSQIQMSTY